MLCDAVHVAPGFLNAFFPDWFSQPPSARLPFTYNAQRTLHWMTYAKAPGYWRSVQPIKVLHYSSSPKPWLAPSPSESPKRGELELKWLQWLMRASRWRPAHPSCEL